MSVPPGSCTSRFARRVRATSGGKFPFGNLAALSPPDEGRKVPPPFVPGRPRRPQTSALLLVSSCEYYTPIPAYLIVARLHDVDNAVDDDIPEAIYDNVDSAVDNDADDVVDNDVNHIVYYDVDNVVDHDMDNNVSDDVENVVEDAIFDDVDFAIDDDIEGVVYTADVVYNNVDDAIVDDFDDVFYDDIDNGVDDTIDDAIYDDVDNAVGNERLREDRNKTQFISSPLKNEEPAILLMNTISFLRRKQTLSSALQFLRSSSSRTASPIPDSLSNYGFNPPKSLSPAGNNGDSDEGFNPHIKKSKPRYRPPSSLDRAGKKPVHSDLPFDFRYSYSESSSNVKPIGLREPKYSPFGPGRIDRVWTGIRAPAVDPTVRSADCEPSGDEDGKKKQARRRSREEILGEPLSMAERKILVDKCQRNRCKRQINLGRDGLTHNMLNDIHNHWKHAEAVRIKCLGVPTVDMDNVCTQLEDKTGGKIIQRQGGTIILYRGRYYNPKKRPVIPLMLWRPHEPVYPKLIKTTIDGLSVEETKEMRKTGLSVPVLIKLAKNGYYGNLVTMVRDAFLVGDLVRIDCQGLERSDYKKIGVKLRDLVPCVLVTFQKEQIVVWKGDDRSSAAMAGLSSSSSEIESDSEEKVPPKISDLFEQDS
ncbi:CRS2-associated factor 1, mitochondrial-like [Wolffia australiana]